MLFSYCNFLFSICVATGHQCNLIIYYYFLLSILFYCIIYFIYYYIVLNYLLYFIVYYHYFAHVYTDRETMLK